MLNLLTVDMARNAAVHGFRSTFRTWGQNEISIEREVLEYRLSQGRRLGQLSDFRRSLAAIFRLVVAHHGALTGLNKSLA